MSDPNAVDGATEVPAPNVMAGTPGAFAARWNERSDEERQAYLDAAYNARQRADQCWVQQHERIDEFRDALIRVLQLVNRHEGEQREPGRVLIPAAQVRAALEGRS